MILQKQVLQAEAKKAALFIFVVFFYGVILMK